MVYSVPFSVPALYFLAWSLEGGVPFPQPVNGVSKLFSKLIVRALSLLSHPRLQPSPSFLTPKTSRPTGWGTYLNRKINDVGKVLDESLSRIFPSILTIPRGFSLSYLRNPYFLQRQLFLQWFAPILDMDFLACLFVLIIQNEYHPRNVHFGFAVLWFGFFQILSFALGLMSILWIFLKKMG